jgi:hypothetical protein
VKTMKFARIASSLILLTGLAGIAFGQAGRYTLHLNNSSGYDIREVYVSSSDDIDWHRDLLGSDILYSRGSFNVTNISAGEWDIKLVDEDGDTCERRNVPFFQDRTLNITRDWLLGCEF